MTSNDLILKLKNIVDNTEKGYECKLLEVFPYCKVNGCPFSDGYSCLLRQIAHYENKEV